MNLCVRFLNILATESRFSVDFADWTSAAGALQRCESMFILVYTPPPASPEFNLSLTATNLGVDGFA